MNLIIDISRDVYKEVNTQTTDFNLLKPIGYFT
jgi:hypothetical protein